MKQILKFNACLRGFAQDKKGSSAVEFAIAAPMLLFSLVIMVDVGLAINERMNLDQAVRSGAEYVINNVSDEDKLEKLVVSAAAGSYETSQSDVSNPYRPVSDVSSAVTCHDNPNVTVPIDTLCTGDVPTSIHYRIAAERLYNGLFIPDVGLSSSVEVQVR